MGINGGVAKFKRTGVIPFEWIEALKKCNGGEEHTERFKDVFRVSSSKITIYTKGESEPPQEIQKKVPFVEEALELEVVVVHAEKKSSGYNGHNLIPVGEVFRVLSCMKDNGLTDTDITGALEIDSDKGISYLRKGRERLHTGHLRAIVKKFNLNENVLAPWT